jgi:tetratricopeptide (TPR) repeat protein
LIRSFPLLYTNEELEDLVKDEDPAMEPESKMKFLIPKLEERREEKRDLINPPTHQQVETNTWGLLLTLLGLLYCRTGNASRGIELIRQATQSVPDGKVHLGQLQTLAVELENAGELAEAETYARQTLQMLRDMPKLGKDAPMILGSLTLLTRLEAKQGKFEQADKDFAELSGLVDGMKGGPYEKYEPEIRQNRDDFEKELQDIKESFSKTAY